MTDLQKIYKDAQDLMAKGQYLDAADLYQKIIDEKPDLAEAHLNQGACYFNAGDLDKALAGFEAAIDLNNELYSAHYNRGKILTIQKNFDEAVPSFEKALALQKEAKIYEALSNACNQSNQYEKALDIAAKGLADATGDAAFNLHGERIISFFKLNRAVDALDDVEAILRMKSWSELRPEQVTLYSSVLALKAHDLMKNGKQTEALPLFERVNQTEPDANRLFAHGLCLMQMGREQEAVPFLEKAKASDAENWKISVALGTVSTKNQDFEKGASNFEDALKNDEAKSDVTVNFSYGICLMNLGRRNDARKPLEFVYNNDKTNWIAAALLGAVLLDEKEYEEAVPVLQHAIKASNGKADDTVHYNLAYALLMLQRLEESLEEFEQAKKLNPNNPSVIQAIAQLKPAIEEKRRIDEEFEKQQALEEQERLEQEKQEELKREAEKAKAVAKGDNNGAKGSGNKGLTDEYFESKKPNFKIDKDGKKNRGMISKRIQELQVNLKPDTSTNNYYARKSLEVIPRGITYNGAMKYATWYNDQMKNKGDA